MTPGFAVTGSLKYSKIPHLQGVLIHIFDWSYFTPFYRVRPHYGANLPFGDVLALEWTNRDAFSVKESRKDYKSYPERDKSYP